ncbi:hypothetical protein AAFC00_003936 [Neodothiora populina]|uniref:NAD(P)-binding protein n=1 Tax=Neodothiora populina TaxID=2781224 RepID=A0ABR3PFW1_9PEZI
MAPTIVLVSGANRGLGKGFIELYLAKPNYTVIAANRDPTHPTSKALFDLPKGVGSKLIIVKTDASVATSAQDAVNKLVANEEIKHLDIVIANAGVSYIWPKVSELKIEDLEGHMAPNVYGTVWLFQATLPLLLKSADPKWITIGSTAGCIQNQLPITNAAYATSKIAVHWLTKKMNHEEEKLTAFVISPGWCQTDLGNTGARAFGMEQAPVTVEESCGNMVPLIEGATKETHGGRLIDYQGDELAW